MSYDRAEEAFLRGLIIALPSVKSTSDLGVDPFVYALLILNRLMSYHRIFDLVLLIKLISRCLL